MGEFNSFGPLRELSTKRRKVSQRKLLKKENAKSGLSRMGKRKMQVAGEGICSSLSVHWTRNADSYGTDAEVEKIYRKCVGVHVKYTKSGNIGDVYKANRAKVDGDLDNRLRNMNTQRDLSDCMSNWLSRCGGGPASACISYKIQRDNKVAGHAVGLHKYADGRVSFFEPNSGIFDIDSGKEAQFLKTYEDIVSRVYGWIHEIKVTPFVG